MKLKIERVELKAYKIGDDIHYNGAIDVGTDSIRFNTTSRREVLHYFDMLGQEVSFLEPAGDEALVCCGCKYSAGDKCTNPDYFEEVWVYPTTACSHREEPEDD